MTTPPRLIEVAFPLKQTSLDSVHEKNVRHGHISTLHIWPARRPLAASRAALIATLLPDPGDSDERQKILDKLAGTLKTTTRKKRAANGKLEDQIVEETSGGILHWGRESGPDLDWFRAEIRKAYGGRAPKVLDPFAGGGAIPLEAMRLGCDVTAIDLNPVAWFILKCTLEYPQKLAGQTRPLPAFILRDRDFMTAFFKAQGLAGKTLGAQLARLGLAQTDEPMLTGLQVEAPSLEADLAWHVRAWGQWVLNAARRDLVRFYPTYADFQPLSPEVTEWERRASRWVPLRDDGTLDVEALNAEFDAAYLADKQNPRWVVKPTVAYLWARTVQCKNCRATIPMLKTRWLCKKDNKRVVLTLTPTPSAASPSQGEGRPGVVFGVQTAVPHPIGNAAQRREADKQTGAGTMTRSGAMCPCCDAIMTSEDMRFEAMAGRLGAMMTAVVVDGPHGKEYRLPTSDEIDLALVTEKELDRLYASIPFGLPVESIPRGGSRKGGGSPFTVPTYGINQWFKVFASRQLLSLGTLVEHTRDASYSKLYSSDWAVALGSYLALAISRLADRSSTICHWSLGRETIQNTFSRFALPISWDYSETNPIASSSGTYDGQIEWLAKVVEHCALAEVHAPVASVKHMSSIAITEASAWDVITTDPPYYDAIPYSDLMDFFYVWLRRTLYGLSPDIDAAFCEPLAPKWDHAANDGELVDDASRHGGDAAKSKATYEDGMFRAFQACHRALKPDGRLVIVFAHKHPDAWETLVSAIIRAGFVVDGSWPIQTEMGNRTRALSSAALSSSVWMVCKKRPEAARPGWDNRVLDEMQAKIGTRLRDFWDAGIRGPDFVWAATGPAMEAYSQYPVVRKANAQSELMTVPEFLKHVRRLVVDFVVGRVLSPDGDSTAEVSSLDDVTTYYLLHRHDFGLNDAPIGACILYAVSCNLSDSALVNQHDLLIHSGGQAELEAEEEDEDADTEPAEMEEGTGSKVRLKPWNQRKRPGLGFDPSVDSPRAQRAKLQPALLPEAEPTLPKARAIPLIDQVHRLMQLWKAGDVIKVDEYLDAKGLRQNALFHHLLQALIELAPAGSEERALLESISNHVAARGVAAERLPGL
jgi:putative DNA methylase